MKILCIITTSFILGGGLTNSYLNYYYSFNHKEIHVDFCSSNEINEELKEIIQSHGDNYFKAPRRKKVLSYISFLKKIIKENNYSLIHIHGNSSTMSLEIFASKKAGNNNIIVHSHNVRTKHKFLNQLLNSYLIKNSRVKLACSKEAGKWLYKGNSFCVINNFIDYNKFIFNIEKREKIRKEFNISSDDILIGTIGRLNSQKNQIFLLSSLQKILKENNKLIIVGNGEKRNEIENKIKELNLENNVILAGFRTDVDAFMSAFDLFVFPSIYEGYGMVLIEAQASGLNCICSNKVPKTTNFGLVEYSELEQNLFLSSVEDKLYNLNIINRQDNIKTFNDNVKQKHFDKESCVKKLLDIYFEEGKEKK